MKEYIIKQANSVPNEDAWSNANIAEMNLNPWKEFKYEFNSFARVLYNDEAIYIRMESDEMPVVAKQTERNSPVCTDSCMEFFFCPNIEKGQYFNFEFNALGTLCLSMGNSRYDRKSVEEDTSAFDIKPELLKNGWRISFKIPFDFIKKYVGETSKKMRGNFHKCGSETGHRHYGMWSEIKTEKPDFHRPEFFGNLYFE